MVFGCKKCNNLYKSIGGDAPHNGVCCDETMYVAEVCDCCKKLITADKKGYEFKFTGSDTRKVYCADCFGSVNVADVAPYSVTELTYGAYYDSVAWLDYMSVYEKIDEDVRKSATTK